MQTTKLSWSSGIAGCTHLHVLPWSFIYNIYIVPEKINSQINASISDNCFHSRSVPKVSSQMFMPTVRMTGTYSICSVHHGIEQGGALTHLYFGLPTNIFGVGDDSFYNMKKKHKQKMTYFYIKGITKKLHIKHPSFYTS